MSAEEIVTIDGVKYRILRRGVANDGRVANDGKGPIFEISEADAPPGEVFGELHPAKHDVTGNDCYGPANFGADPAKRSVLLKLIEKLSLPIA
jgi:hypothetical protein